MEKSIAELLSLSPEELVVIEPFSQLKERHLKDKLSSQDRVELNLLVKNIGLSLLIKLAITDPVMNEMFEEPCLNEFWDAQWVDCSKIGLREEDVSFRYQPQATIHSFTLLKGIFIYGLYKQYSQLADSVNNIDKTAGELLILAANLYNYPALNQLVLQLCKTEDFFSRSQAIPYAKTAAALYFTPGYLLLATVFYRQNNYLDALQTLILAQLLIPYSADYINNAYRGQTLDEIIKPSFGSIEAGIATLAGLANIPLTEVVRSIYPSVEKVRDNIVKQNALTESIRRTECSSYTSGF